MLKQLAQIRKIQESRCVPMARGGLALLLALRGAVAQDASASVPTIEGCPACSLHGYCSEEEGWRCLCDEGFTGVDC